MEYIIFWHIIEKKMAMKFWNSFANTYQLINLNLVN